MDIVDLAAQAASQPGQPADPQGVPIQPAPFSVTVGVTQGDGQPNAVIIILQGVYGAQHYFMEPSMAEQVAEALAANAVQARSGLTVAAPGASRLPPRPGLSLAPDHHG